jgi:hypothetical protein
VTQQKRFSQGTPPRPPQQQHTREIRNERRNNFGCRPTSVGFLSYFKQTVNKHTALLTAQLCYFDRRRRCSEPIIYIFQDTIRNLLLGFDCLHLRGFCSRAIFFNALNANSMFWNVRVEKKSSLVVRAMWRVAINKSRSQEIELVLSSERERINSLWLHKHLSLLLTMRAGSV